MSEHMDVLSAQEYVHLPDFLDKENCAELTEILQEIVSGGAAVSDIQCPKSQSVGHSAVFDSLLEQLTPNFEEACGKKLLPTYAYARLYAPGEELKIHTDRPACEISATITLGFEGDCWPIFMGDGDKKSHTKVTMGVGDVVLYRGMDVPHWREPYKEGLWQAQVFLHYVDASGPHAEWKFDKRKKLAHHTEPDYTYFTLADALAPDACAKLVESLESQAEGEAAGIGDAESGVLLDKKIRDVKRVGLPCHRGIGAAMAGIGLAANQKAWKFDVTHTNQTDYLKYDKDGHYHAHVDTFISPNAVETRKLTVLVFLNDDFEGGKLFIQCGANKIYPPQKAGMAVVFPSFLVHGVEPVTSGTRRSVVSWLVGPWFK